MNKHSFHFLMKGSPLNTHVFKIYNLIIFFVKDKCLYPCYNQFAESNGVNFYEGPV